MNPNQTWLQALMFFISFNICQSQEKQIAYKVVGMVEYRKDRNVILSSRNKRYWFEIIDLGFKIGDEYDLILEVEKSKDTLKRASVLKSQISRRQWYIDSQETIGFLTKNNFIVLDTYMED